MKAMQVIAAAMLLVITSAAAASEKFDSADKAAGFILSQLPDIQVEALKSIGLQNADEAKQGALDKPFSVYMVRLDALRAYDGSNGDEGLLFDLEQSLYPVVVGKVALAAVGVHNTAEGWEAREISSPELMNRMLEVRRTAMSEGKKSADSYFAVRIPALDMVFVATREARGLTLRSTFDIPEIGLKAGAAISGKALFKKLAPVARAQNDMTP